MREVTEYKWEELKKRLRRRIVKTGETQAKIVSQINQEEDTWKKVYGLTEKEKYDREIETYQRVLKTMDDLEEDER